LGCSVFARREIRQDEAADLSHTAYKNLIESLQYENERLRKNNADLENIVSRQRGYIQKLTAICLSAQLTIPVDPSLMNLEINQKS
jgi:hypothetical protein